MIGKLRATCFNQLLKFNRDGLLVKNSKNSNKAAPDLSSLLQMAISMHNNNKLEDAAKLYEYVLSIDPRNFNALHMLGEVSFRNGDLGGAVELYSKAIAVNSNHAAAHSNLGNALIREKKFDEALLSFDRAIALDPVYAEAFNNRGNALLGLGRADEAAASFNQAIALMPKYPEAFNNLGIALLELKRPSDALAAFERAIELKPDYAEALYNHGNALLESKRVHEAFNSFERAVTLRPDYAEAWNNRGNALLELKRPKEAFESYGQASSRRPGYAQALYNQSIYLLSSYDFDRGWSLYQWRWEGSQPPVAPLRTSIPAWQERRDVKSVLVWAEQGIGDEIFYARVLAGFAPDHLRITLAADKRLQELFGRSFTDFQLIETGMIDGAARDQFDAQTPIGEVGRILGVDRGSMLEKKIPDLSVDDRRRDAFRRRFILGGSKILCGLSWRSKSRRLGDAKSLALDELLPILQVQGVEFVNLQYGEVESEIKSLQERFGVRIHRLEDLDLFRDVDGLASLIAACDCIVTASNVTAHLAGAVGKRGLVLLPYAKGLIWYWHEGSGRSLWYPSLSLTSQTQSDNWDFPVGEAVRWLRQMVGEKAEEK